MSLFEIGRFHLKSRFLTSFDKLEDLRNDTIGLLPSAFPLLPPSSHSPSSAWLLFYLFSIIDPRPRKGSDPLSQSAYSILLGSVIGPRVAGDLGVSSQKEGTILQPVVGETVTPIHTKENKRKQATPAVMAHQPAIMRTGSQRRKPKLMK